MKVRVTIECEVPDHTPGYGDGKNGAWVVSLVLADALGEFVSARYPAERYVETRYANCPWLNKKEKIAQVRARNLIAEALSTRNLREYGTLKIEEVT